jgi:hypothetical protein
LYEAVVRRLPDRSQARNPFFKPGRCFEFDTGWVWQGEIQDRVNATEDLIEDRFWPKAAVKRMAHTASTSALHTVAAASAGNCWRKPANLRHAARVRGGSNQWTSPDRTREGAADGARYRSSS